MFLALSVYWLYFGVLAVIAFVVVLAVSGVAALGWALVFDRSGDPDNPKRPGWYTFSDPELGRYQKYWDGSEWHSTYP